MIADIYSGLHSTASRTAVAAFERAVDAFAAHRAFMPLLRTSLEHDGTLVAAHALTGIAHALVGRAHGMATARELLSGTRNALESAGGGTTYERALAGAHAQSADGNLAAAAAILETHLKVNPLDLLAFKLAHALRFMSGQVESMLATSAAVLPSWSERTPGYGYVLGCRAFALEETGELRQAEQIAHQALSHEPGDVWALHAVAHVLEMENRVREGRLLLETSRKNWADCGGFGNHLLWHLALFHISTGDHERALALYDDGILPSPDGCFRDMANAVSLLWRLEQEGIDVGSRWDQVYEIAHERRLDATYAFGSLHYLLALMAKGDRSGAEELIAAMREEAGSDRGEQGCVMRHAALPLADALLHTPIPTAHAVADRLHQIGGSRAQRDVFLRTMMLDAGRNSNVVALSALSEIRRQQRQDDRFTEIVRRRSLTPGHRRQGEQASEAV